MKPSRTRKDKPSSVKSWRYEIIGLTKESSDRWHKMQDSARELVNLWWQLWCARHVAAGNNLAIMEWMRAVRDARHNNTAPPKCPIPIMPPDTQDTASIYCVLSARYRDIHTRTIILLQHLITDRLTGKDCDGRWNLWHSVLACRQGQPGCEKDQPLPFDAKSSKLPVRVDDREQMGLRGSRWRFDVTLAREEVEGKTRCESIHDSFTIIAKGSGEAIIKRIASGEYSFRGSKIFYSQSKGKWFASLCYAIPGTERGMARDGTGILRPGINTPWKFRVPLSNSRPCPEKYGSRRQSFLRGGYGRHITAARQRLLTSRWTEQETIQWAGSARRGHGRKRALGPIEKLRNSWRQIVTGYNHKLTSAIVKECVENGIGTLIYCQPTGNLRENRFLSRAGKLEGRRDGSLWDWGQIGTMLQYKCKEAGLHIIVRKSREATSERTLHRTGQQLRAGRSATTRKVVSGSNNGNDLRRPGRRK